MDSVWQWFVIRPGFLPQPGKAALFLDRDGVLVSDTGYLKDPHLVTLQEGAADLVGMANRYNVPAILVTNQSGIGRGLLTWDDFDRVNRSMADKLFACHARLDAVLACAWHPSLGSADRAIRLWRKPGAGMIDAAARAFALDQSRSWLVGDRWSDVRAAMRAGLAGAVLVRPGLPVSSRSGSRSSFRLWTAPDLSRLPGGIEAFLVSLATAATPGNPR